MFVEKQTSRSSPFRQLHAPAHTSLGWYQGGVQVSFHTGENLAWLFEISYPLEQPRARCLSRWCCPYSFSAYLQHTRTWCGCLSLSLCLSGTTPLGPRSSGPMPTRRREQVPAARLQQQQQPAQQQQQQEEEMVTTSRRLLRLRGFGCGGSW